MRRSICAATRQQERREVAHLLRDLREQGLCAAARVDTTPADDLVASFEHYLRHQQGLADTTVERYRTVAWQFLTERFGRRAVDLGTIGAVDAISFVQRQAKRMQPPAVTLRQWTAFVPALRPVPRGGRARACRRRAGGRQLGMHTSLAQGNLGRARAACN